MEEFETKIKLTGTVNDITFRNDTNGYTVFDVDTGDEEITVVGTVADIKIGDKVELVGDYVYHSVYGRQFKAEFCTALMPETVEDLYHYLASGVVKGVGPSTAQKIIDTFRDEAFYIIENEPEKLAEIEGITLKKARKIFGWLDRLGKVIYNGCGAYREA